MTSALLLTVVLASQAPQLPQQQWVDPHAVAEKAGSVIVNVAIAAVGVSSMVDLAITEFYIGAGVLNEANPLLRRWEKSPTQMGLAKALFTGAEIYILDKLKDKHRLWTYLTAVAITGANVWAIRHNLREARPR